MLWLWYGFPTGEETRVKAAENAQLIFTFNIALKFWAIDLAGQELKIYLWLTYLNRQNVKGVDGVCESIDDFIIFWSKGSYKRTFIIH